MKFSKATSPRSYAPLEKSLKYSTWLATVNGAALSAPVSMSHGRHERQSATKPDASVFTFVGYARLT